MTSTTRPDPETGEFPLETDAPDAATETTKWTSIDELGGEAPCYAHFFEEPDD